jgi:hypothetical protein
MLNTECQRTDSGLQVESMRYYKPVLRPTGTLQLSVFTRTTVAAGTSDRFHCFDVT